MANYKIKEYRGRHNWVERRLGKPKYCVNCESVNKKLYHWANISGNYLKELSDWKRLCVNCHRIETVASLPKKEFCVRGHTRILENLSSAGACKICKNDWNKAYFAKKRMQLA